MFLPQKCWRSSHACRQGLSPQLGNTRALWWQGYPRRHAWRGNRAWIFAVCRRFGAWRDRLSTYERICTVLSQCEECKGANPAYLLNSFCSYSMEARKGKSALSSHVSLWWARLAPTYLSTLVTQQDQSEHVHISFFINMPMCENASHLCIFEGWQRCRLSCYRQQITAQCRTESTPALKYIHLHTCVCIHHTRAHPRCG